MIKGLSLFANVGIGELYLKEVGVDIIVANELLEDRAKFYREVYPECDMIQGDITNKKVFQKVIESAKKNDVQFLVATPPCFIPGTLVMTSQGEVAIEKITSEHKVLSHTNNLRQVFQLIRKPYVGKIYKIKTYHNVEIHATPDHPFFVRTEDGYKKINASDITIDSVLLKSSHQHNMKVVSVSTYEYDGPVYTLEVDVDNSYTVHGIGVANCQGMSIAGQQDPDDPRNTLILKVIEAIKKINPKYAIIENVPQMLKSYIPYKGEKTLIIDVINKELGKKYNIKTQVMDAAEYETPQYRKRAIILLSQNEEWALPEKQPHITVEGAIGHLPTLESGEKSNIPLHNSKDHNPNHILWMKHTPTGKTSRDNKVHYPKKDGRPIKGFRSTYQRINWDRPSTTITMNNGDVGSQSNVHPGRPKADGTYSDARVMTIHELLLLSGIPLDWKIPTWANERLIRRVIGEMVAPKLLRALVEKLNLTKKSKNKTQK